MMDRPALRAVSVLLAASTALSVASCRSDRGGGEAERTAATAQADSPGPVSNRGGSARTGAYYDPFFTVANVRHLQRLASFNVPGGGTIYAQPLIVPDVPHPGFPARTLMLVATSTNDLFAYDVGGASRDPVMTFHFGNGDAPFLSAIPDSVGQGPPDPQNPKQPVNCPNIAQAGILSTPVVDLATFTVHLVAEVAVAGDAAVEHQLYAVNLVDGSRVGPQPVRPLSASNFLARHHLQRPGLLLQNGAVFIAFSSSCDWPNPYDGWVIAHRARTLEHLAEWCSGCGNPTGGQAGIWQSGAGLTTDGTSVYLQNGNDSSAFGQDPQHRFDPTRLSVSLVKLDVTGVGAGSIRLSGSLTPLNADRLNANDLDLGVSGVAVLPQGVLLSGSKEGKLYLTRASALTVGVLGEPAGVVRSIQATCTHFDNCGTAPGALPQPENCQGAKQPDNPMVPCAPDQNWWPHIHGTPVFWPTRNFVYAWGQRDFLRRFHVDLSALTFDVPDLIQPPRGNELDTPEYGAGGMLSLSVNANVDQAIVWASNRLTGCKGNRCGLWTDQRYRDGEFSPGVLRAYDADTMQLLFTSEPDTAYAQSKFVPPTIRKRSGVGDGPLLTERARAPRARVSRALRATHRR